MEDFILFEMKDQVACITLNRPQAFNSFNRPMALQLQSILDSCEKDESVRAILLTGNGKAFCAGQDLKEITAEDGPSLIRNIEKPIVCAVNGVAAGAGANIALACDITVAAESSSFIQAFSKIGLIPDSGGTFFLPRIIGRQMATALMMLGDKISATDADKMGMIYKSCSDDNFADEALAIASRLSKMPTVGLGLTKRALNKSLTNDLDMQLAVEDLLQTAASNTEDYKEGVQAFLEKRKPNFKGK